MKRLKEADEEDVIDMVTGMSIIEYGIGMLETADTDKAFSKQLGSISKILQSIDKDMMALYPETEDEKYITRIVDEVYHYLQKF